MESTNRVDPDVAFEDVTHISENLNEVLEGFDCGLNAVCVGGTGNLTKHIGEEMGERFKPDLDIYMYGCPDMVRWADRIFKEIGFESLTSKERLKLGNGGIYFFEPTDHNDTCIEKIDLLVGEVPKEPFNFEFYCHNKERWPGFENIYSLKGGAIAEKKAIRFINGEQDQLHDLNLLLNQVEETEKFLGEWKDAHEVVMKSYENLNKKSYVIPDDLQQIVGKVKEELDNEGYKRLR